MLSSSLAGGVEGFEGGDRDGEESCRWRGLFCVSCKFLDQVKVKLSQLVVPEVAGHHGCEYIPGGTKVPLHRTILDGYPSDC